MQMNNLDIEFEKKKQKKSKSFSPPSEIFADFSEKNKSPICRADLSVLFDFELN